METNRIEKNILLRAPRARVWRALADSTEFGSWFGLKVDGPFVAGQAVRAAISPTAVDADVASAQKKYEGFPFEMMIEKMEPERLFSFRWHPFSIDEKAADDPATTLVVFQLEEVPEGVMLTLTESGFDQLLAERRAKAFSANEQGWSMVVTLIQKYVSHAE